MQRNFLKFFCLEDNLGAKEVREGSPMGPTRHQGTPEAPGAPWWVVGPTGVIPTASQPINTQIFQKP